MCRVFKKNIQIPKRKGGEEEEEVAEESTSVGKDENIEEERLKIASAETTSSELTQGVLLDEANSSSLFALHFSSSLLDDHDHLFSNYTHQLPYHHPPLQLQDFPQLSMNETEIMSIQQDFQCRDSMNGTLDEIFSSSATFPASL